MNIKKKIKYIGQLQWNRYKFQKNMNSIYSTLKKYVSNWSTEILKIDKAQLTNPITYLLKNAKQSECVGSFYVQKLSKLKYLAVFLIEKLLKRKHTEKWGGC